MDALKSSSAQRGKGRGAGRRGGGRGGGRGRGRGGAKIKFDNKLDISEDDALCNMALIEAEANNNSITKTFEALNENSQLEGFDATSGNIWIYPTNRDVRDYQYNMVKTALFNNTLVSLPTGLGKTFISAVVMYNFQRWYPNGIIVFMAPTRPLVTQQLDACHNTVGISPDKTIELTGSILPKKREVLWKTKTVFFLTPQVMISDLNRNFFAAENVRCVVVDEAHKALGNHAYVQVISKLVERNKLFRVLALSATPGSDILSVQQVLMNLLISRVELRSENSPDVLPYINAKDTEKIVVKIDGFLKEVHYKVTDIFQTYSGKLLKAGALSGRDGSSYSKFQLLKARDSFRQGLGQKIAGYQKGYIEGDFAVCISLSHAIEILLSHGLRSFYIFLHAVINKEKGSANVSAELRKNETLQALLAEIQEKLDISVENSTFDFNSSSFCIDSKVDDVSFARIANRTLNNDNVDYTLSHPKLKILKDLVHRHFLDYQSKNDSTRIMIFSQYRDSVQEIGNMLSSLRPLVKPMIFVGKSSAGNASRGLKQKDQVNIVQQFRDGGFNVLVSTSVGEEGLDIGEVDLIICFDASKSPTRLIQRMGRTGRQRDGRTVFLLTAGKEERSCGASFSMHTSISKNITDPKKLEPFLYKLSPRMVPAGVDPTCYKMSIILSTEQSSMSSSPVKKDSEEAHSNTIESVVTKNKPATTTKSKAQRKPKETKKKPTENVIAKMFDRIKNAEPGKESLEQKSECQKIDRTSCEPEVVPRNNYDINHGFQDYDDDIHMLVVEPRRSIGKCSAYHKIFGTDNEERKSLKPCTTFVKKERPKTDVVRKLLDSGISSDHILFDDETFSSFECRLKARKSFIYSGSEYCDCGNTMEENISVDSDETRCSSRSNTSVLYSESESRHRDEGKRSSLPTSRGHSMSSESASTNFSPNNSVDEFAASPIVVCKPVSLKTSRLDSQFPGTFQKDVSKEECANKFVTSPKFEETPFIVSPPKTPPEFPESLENDCSSTDVDEFAASPEICENRIYDRFKKMKASKSQNLQQEQKPKEQETVNLPLPQDELSDKSKFRVPKARRSLFPPKAEKPKSAETTKSFKFKSKVVQLPPTKRFKIEYIDDDDDDFIDLPRKIFRRPMSARSSPAFKATKLDRHGTNKVAVLEKSGINISEKPKTSDESFSNHHDFDVADTSYRESMVTASVSNPRANKSNSSIDEDSSLISKNIFKPPKPKTDAKSHQPKNVINSRIFDNNFKSPILTKNHKSPFSDFKAPFSIPRTSSPSTSTASIRSRVQSPTSPIASGRSSNEFTFVSPVSRKRGHVKRKRFESRNPFIATQAEEDGDDDSDATSDHDGEHLDELNDSFVDDNESFRVTDSERAMYFQSVKDLPTKTFGRIEKPLSPKNYGNELDDENECYDEEDSFCQPNDEVEFMDVGVFTQAMNQAKMDLASGTSSANNCRTRRAKQLQASGNITDNHSSDKSPKRRRRVITIDDSSDDDFL